MLWYGFASAAPAASNFLIASLLLRSLGAKGFARWSLIEPLLLVGANFMTFGAQFGALRRVSEDHSAARRALSAVFLGFLLLFPLNVLVGGPIYASSFGATAAAALLFAQLAEAAASSSATIFRARQMPVTYSVLEGGRILVILGVIGLSLIPGAPTPRSPEQLALLRGLVSAGFVLCLVTSLVPPTRPSPALTWSFLKYGLPIFFGQIAVQTALNADRYILNWVKADYAQIASYVVHARMAGVLNLALLAPLSLWYPVEVTRRDRSNDHLFFEATAAVTAAIALLAIVGLQLSAQFAWPFLFPSVAMDKPLLLLLSSCVALQAMAVIWNIGGLRPGSTRWNMAPPLVALLVLTLSGIPLTHLFGAVGTAASRLLALVAYAFSFRLISLRITGTTSPLKRLAWFAAGMAATPLLSVGAIPLTIVGLLLTIACIGAGLYQNGRAIEATFGSRSEMVAR